MYKRQPGNLSLDERVLLLRKIHDRNLNEDEQEFLDKYMEKEGYDDWEEAYAGAKEAVEDEDEPQTGAAIIAHDKAKIRTLREERAELQRQAAVTEVVPVLMSDGTTTDNRTYQGTEAIRSAKQKNLKIQGKLKSRARDIPNREQIEALQNKLRFAMEFYAGIDQIFSSDDTVPPTSEWPSTNFRSPLVGYVVWGMANRQPGVDRLLFKPQATYVRRLVRTPQQPSIRKIQYMILTDRLSRGDNRDILDVNEEQGDAYKNRLLGISPKRDQKPPAETPGTVERPSKGRSLEGVYGGSVRENQKAKKKQRKKKQLRINEMPGMKTAKAHTPRGSPTANDDVKMKARSRSPPLVRGGSGSQTTEMLHKLSLKF